MTVAVREGWRLARAERRQAAVDPAELEGAPGPERDLEQRLRALAALEALAGLRPAERRLLCLPHAGYSYREISAIERSGANYVNKQLVRARRALRERERGEI